MIFTGRGLKMVCPEMGYTGIPLSIAVLYNGAIDTLTMRFWVVPRQIQAGQFHLLPLSSQLSMLVGQMQFIAGYIAIYCQSTPSLLRTKSNCWLVKFQLSVITSDLWKVQPLSSWLIS